MRRFGALLVMALAWGASLGDARADPGRDAVVGTAVTDMAGCIVEAAHAFGHEPQTLVAILAVEKGRVGGSSSNRDGSVDYGPFQYNSSGIEELRKRLGLATRDEAVRVVRDDFCAAAVVASWWLKQKTALVQGNRRRGVGAYNSATPGKLEAYLKRVDQQAMRLFGRPVASGPAVADVN